MTRCLFYLALFCLYCLKSVRGQAYADIFSFSNQNFFSNYSDSSKNPLYTQDNFLNLFIPKKFGNNHLFLLRINSEKLTINRMGSPGYSQQLYSLALPIGLQLSSKNKKWKYTGVFIPKLSSDFNDNLSNDYQFGGIGLLTRVYRDDLQIKLGLYYNREFFGNFFMPLLGADWKINRRWQMYGTLPSNFRAEYKLSSLWACGVGFRSFQRSYRLCNSNQNDFVWIKENQLKLYLEGFLIKNLVFTMDVYRTINYSFPRNDRYAVKKQKEGTPALQGCKDNFGFTLGFSYRLMAGKTEGAAK